MQNIKNNTKGILTRVSDLALKKSDAKLDQLEESLKSTNVFIESLRQEIRNGNVSSRTIVTSPDEAITKLFSGVIIYLDPKDVSVSPHIMLSGIWEEWVTKAWLNVLESSDTVFDVGANFGYFGLIAAQRLAGEGRAIMFEPNLDLVEYINKSLSVNWFHENVKTENLAISDKSGTQKLTILEDYVGLSSLQSEQKLNTYLSKKMDVRTKRIDTVSTISIDDYCLQNKISVVDLMKLDIEGYEETAYNGMSKTIARSKNLTLFIEFTKDAYEDPKAFYSKMTKDFKNVYGINDSGRLEKYKDQRYEKIIENSGDWVMLVFSKKDLT